MTDLPHFALPFRFGPVSSSAGPGQAATVNEQDSVHEIAACAMAVLLCPRGFRSELPTFGITDPTFATPQVDLERIRRAIELWEPRASMLLDQSRDAMDDLVARAEVLIRVRTRE
jgi:hypothetical protein